MLTTADLDFMRDVQELGLPGTVVISRVSLVSDGAGNYYETWAGAGTVVGRIYPQVSRSGGESSGGDSPHSHTTWWATFPVGTDVSPRDRLVYSGRSWEVLTTNNDEMWQTAVRCELISHDEEYRDRPADYLLDFSDVDNSMYLAVI